MAGGIRGRYESGEDIRFANQLTIRFNDNTPVSNRPHELIRLEMKVKANLEKKEYGIQMEGNRERISLFRFIITLGLYHPFLYIFPLISKHAVGTCYETTNTYNELLYIYYIPGDFSASVYGKVKKYNPSNTRTCWQVGEFTLQPAQWLDTVCRLTQTMSPIITQDIISELRANIYSSPVIR